MYVYPFTQLGILFFPLPLRMTIRSSLTLGQLLAFLHNKWHLGEGGVREEGGGGDARVGGEDRYQRLKLYHTHGGSQDLNSSQYSCASHCAALQSALVAVTSSHDGGTASQDTPSHSTKRDGAAPQSNQADSSISNTVSPTCTCSTVDASKCVRQCACEKNREHMSAVSSSRAQVENDSAPMQVSAVDVSQTDSDSKCRGEGESLRQDDSSGSGCSVACSARDSQPSAEKPVPNTCTGREGSCTRASTCTGEKFITQGGKGSELMVESVAGSSVQALDCSPQCILSTIDHQVYTL